MQNTYGVRHRSENFVEALVAVGRLVEPAAAQFDTRAIDPCTHHLLGNLSGTLAFAGLAIVDSRRFLATHCTACAVDSGVKTVLCIIVLYSFKDDGLIAHPA